MKKPVIFLDFDGLQFNTLIANIVYINDKYNIRTLPTDYMKGLSLESIIKNHVSLEKKSLITYENVYEDLGENFLNSIEWHEMIPPLENMVEVVNDLSKKYDLWTVTARQMSSIKTVKHLSDKHIPGCIRGFHFVWKHLGNGSFSSITKKDFIQSFDGERVAFIDDSIHEIKALDNVVPSYFFDKHESNEHHPNHYKFKDWEEIGKKFL